LLCNHSLLFTPVHCTAPFYSSIYIPRSLKAVLTFEA
jgi:hypothetical protein